MIVDTHCLLLPLIEEINSMNPTEELAASFEAILTTPNHCGKSVGPALQWARAFNSVDTRLPEKNNDLTQLISVPLLIWGLRQPWAETISVFHVVNFWFKYQERVARTQEKILEQAWTTHAVRLCIQDPHANRARADDLCREWSFMMDHNVDLWKFSYAFDRHAHHIYNGWLDMGRLALPNLHDMDNPSRTLQSSWLIRVGLAFKNTPTQQQSDFLLRLLTSDLPQLLKIKVAKKASASSWLHSEAHAILRSMLPEKDHACYLDLPWTRQTGNIKIEAVIFANQSVANLYCPTLQPAFSLMLAEADWTNREKVCHVANLGRVGNTPLDELSLGNLLAVE